MKANPNFGIAIVGSALGIAILTFLGLLPEQPGKKPRAMQAWQDPVEVEQATVVKAVKKTPRDLREGWLVL